MNEPRFDCDDVPEEGFEMQIDEEALYLMDEAIRENDFRYQIACARDQRELQFTDWP